MRRELGWVDGGQDGGQCEGKIGGKDGGQDARGRFEGKIRGKDGGKIRGEDWRRNWWDTWWVIYPRWACTSRTLSGPANRDQPSANLSRTGRQETTRIWSCTGYGINDWPGSPSNLNVPSAVLCCSASSRTLFLFGEHLSSQIETERINTEIIGTQWTRSTSA